MVVRFYVACNTHMFANLISSPHMTLSPTLEPWAKRASGAGGGVLRYSLVFFLLVFGAAKWTAGEAAGIQPLLAHSPLFFWLTPLAGVRGASESIGVVELTLGTLIALRHWLPALSALGSLLAAGMFLTTLSFLFTTPGLDPQSADAGFLLKDLTLFGAALWSAGEAATAVRTH